MSMFTSDGIEVLPDNNAVPSFDDIAMGLARQIRFGGQTRVPYSVLAHTIALSRHVPLHMRIFALMHDSTEAVVGDIVRPWKSKEFEAMEDALLERICIYYGIVWPWPEEISKVIHEADRLMGNSEGYVLGFFPEGSQYDHDESMMETVRQMIPASKQWVINPDWGIKKFKMMVNGALQDWARYKQIARDRGIV